MKKKKETEEASINRGEENTGCDSCHLPLGLFENVQKEWNRKKRDTTKIRGSNIAMNWHS